MHFCGYREWVFRREVLHLAAIWILSMRQDSHLALRFPHRYFLFHPLRHLDKVKSNYRPLQKQMKVTQTPPTIPSPKPVPIPRVLVPLSRETPRNSPSRSRIHLGQEPITPQLNRVPLRPTWTDSSKITNGKHPSRVVKYGTEYFGV